MAMLPAPLAKRGPSLILSAVLSGMCGWDTRVMAVVLSFPHLVLIITEKEAHIEDDRRVSVVQLLLRKDDCCLRTKYSDFTVKFKAQYLGELRATAAEKKVPLNMYGFLLSVRSVAGLDTQEVEGSISTLQLMGDRGRKLEIPGANAKMSLKLDQSITVDDCIAMESAVEANMESLDYANRFLPITIDVDSAPASIPVRPCMHKLEDFDGLGLSMARSCYQQVVVGGHQAHWFLVNEEERVVRTTVFILAFSHHPSVKGCRGRFVVGADDTWSVVRGDPVVLIHLQAVLSDLVRDAGGFGRLAPRVVWESCAVTRSWPNFTRGSIDLASTTSVELNGALAEKSCQSRHSNCHACHIHCFRT